MLTDFVLFCILIAVLVAVMASAFNHIGYEFKFIDALLLAIGGILAFSLSCGLTMFIIALVRG